MTGAADPSMTSKVIGTSSSGRLPAKQRIDSST